MIGGWQLEISSWSRRKYPSLRALPSYLNRAQPLLMGTSEVVLTRASADLGEGTKNVEGYISYPLSPLHLSRSYHCLHWADKEIESICAYLGLSSPII